MTTDADDRSAGGGTSPADLELLVSMPNDARLAGAVKALAVCAAQQAGCGEAAAAAFGSSVEDAVRASLQGRGAGTLPVTVRQRSSAVEVVVNGRALVLKA